MQRFKEGAGTAMRRILGALVMLAGVLGLVMSLAGLVMVWVVKPTIAVYADSTVRTLQKSIVTSQSLIDNTSEALAATIDSVDALSDMLGTTAATVEDTKPIITELDIIMSTTLPTTLEATTESLYTAQQAAQVLESAIQSLDAFRFLLSATPLLGDLMEPPTESYMPEKPLADSLGEVAAGMEDLPDTFTEMSTHLSATDDKLADIQTNLITMADSVKLISASLSEYETMISQSKSSMDEMASILTSIQINLPRVLNGVAIGISLFLVWLLAAQVVILSQGWELYHGTADRVERPAESTPPPTD